MAAVSGHDMTLSVEGDVLAYARSVTINFAQDTIDVTTADSNWWKEYLASLRGWTIDAEALYLKTDEARSFLEYHWSARSPATLTVIVTLPGGTTYTGEAILTAMGYAGPYADALTTSVSLQGTGALTPNPVS
jgi:predicted secreted protein